MTNFVLVYTGGATPENIADPDAVMAEWGAWYGQMGASIVDGGKPFGASKHISPKGVVSNGPASSPAANGYTVISADSLDGAVAKLKDHPHLKYDGHISVYETFDM